MLRLGAFLLYLALLLLLKVACGSGESCLKITSCSSESDQPDRRTSASGASVLGKAGPRGPRGEKGTKGDSAIDGGVIARIEATEANLRELAAAAEVLRSDLDLARSEIGNLTAERERGRRRFRIEKTPRSSTMNGAQSMCVEMGGRLVFESLMRPEEEGGFDYSVDMSRLITGATWVGLTDRGHEGKWTGPDGQEMGRRELVYPWYPGQPDNWRGYEHCVYAHAGTMRDVHCTDYPRYGLCEVSVI